jgi:Concanavalin A-like lectin/glucanases superfamily
MPAVSSSGGAFGYGRPPRAAAAAAGGSLFFAGTASSYLTTPDSTDFRSTGNFTIEWYQYMSSGSPNYPRVFSQGSYPSATIAFSLESGSASNTSRTGYVWINNSAVISATVTNFTNQWVHFAICRSGTTVRLFQNGTQIGSATNSATIDGTAVLTIGNESSPSAVAAFKGYITNFRWCTQGLYSGNFTRPTPPLTAVSGTVLLLLATTSGTATTDSSGTGKVITNTGVTWNSLYP